jgi:hypothetical protein
MPIPGPILYSRKGSPTTSQRSSDTDRILRHVESLGSIRHDRAGHVLPAPSSVQASSSRNCCILLPTDGSFRHGRMYHHVPGSVSHTVFPQVEFFDNLTIAR